MKKYFLFIFFPLFVLSANAGEGRYTFPLTGRGWSLWLDKEAGWQNDVFVACESSYWWLAGFE